MEGALHQNMSAYTDLSMPDLQLRNNDTSRALGMLVTGRTRLMTCLGMLLLMKLSSL